MPDPSLASNQSRNFVVPKGMPPRTGVAPPQAVASQQRKERPEHGALKPLNFRIPADFRRLFKSYAARHDLKLNELLLRCFDAYRAQQGD